MSTSTTSQDHSAFRFLAWLYIVVPEQTILSVIAHLGRGDKSVEYSPQINRLVLHFPAMSEKQLIILLIVYLLELLVVAAAAFLLLRSALFPRGSESRGIVNRGIRLCGALLLSVGAFVLLKLVL